MSARTLPGAVTGRRFLQRKCACGGTCPKCARAAREAPSAVRDVLRGSAQPLDLPTRMEMESRFAHDFARVRIHADAASAASARALEADAYTIGSHIVFGAGRYTPRTEAGKRLLAHELAHTVQQRAHVPSGPVALTDDPALEREADAAARFAPRARGPVLHRGTGLMRQKKKPPADFIYKYDRADFANRFDGEVDAANHRTTLVMRLQLVDMGAEEGREGRIGAFAAKAVPIIESAWSGKFALKSACAADKFETRVRIVITDANPHHTVHVWANAGERSSSTNWQFGDLETRYRESPVLVDPKKPPTPDNMKMMTFAQIPAAHEFGHLIGLHHVLCDDNAERCYGVTAEQKLDIMGYGMEVSPRDYAPFQKIMERYGQDTQPKECNTWSLVTPG